jgi:hypothetical protein
MLLVVTLACSLGGAAKESESPPPSTTLVSAVTSVPTTAPTPTVASVAAEAQPTPETAPSGDSPVAEEPTSPPTAPAGPTDYDTVFPLPDDVQNFTGSGGEGMVNFQTSLSLEEVVAFYRQSFAEKGLTERSILTTIDDSGFSMVFDGWDNGKALVIQGVDMGASVNVNIRFEGV